MGSGGPEPASAVVAGSAAAVRTGVGFGAGIGIGADFGFFESSGDSARIDDSRSWRVTASMRCIAASSIGVNDAAGDDALGDSDDALGDSSADKAAGTWDGAAVALFGVFAAATGNAPAVGATQPVLP
jgi:hypothetical protein